MIFSGQNRTCHSNMAILHLLLSKDLGIEVPAHFSLVDVSPSELELL